MIPFYRLIQSSFGFDNSLINSNIWNEFFLACSTIQSNKDHLEEPSLG
uniref:Uncharacterized protein n=1 Tax=virus sp. ct1Uu26 TaxID=2826789 RepID=A0A8S5R7Y4_9VIRU|nr:MAG TPA: hypothetical protein [virus sp. ct1Uu26]